MENVTITMTYEQALSAYCAVCSSLAVMSNSRELHAKDDPQDPALLDFDRTLEALKAARAAIDEAL